MSEQLALWSEQLESIASLALALEMLYKEKHKDLSPYLIADAINGLYFSVNQVAYEINDLADELRKKEEAEDLAR